MEIGNKVRNNFIKKNRNKVHRVLIENFKNGKWYGWTENYIQVALEGEYMRGELVDIILDEDILAG
ncbi:hypothetical protein KKG31_07980 [Patescibacteria group bacterium]|nr:hypothetical protein [Patescibacteria group bacterium]MBU1759003.1 hypothetical protein [Patescibacteria group bacterium]